MSMALWDLLRGQRQPAPPENPDAPLRRLTDVLQPPEQIFRAPTPEEGPLPPSQPAPAAGGLDPIMRAVGALTPVQPGSQAHRLSSQALGLPAPPSEGPELGIMPWLPGQFARPLPSQPGASPLTSVIDPRTGQHVGGRAEYAVNILADQPARSMTVPGLATMDHLSSFATQHADVLERPNARIMTRFDPATNQSTLSIVAGT